MTNDTEEKSNNDERHRGNIINNANLSSTEGALSCLLEYIREMLLGNRAYSRNILCERAVPKRVTF